MASLGSKTTATVTAQTAASTAPTTTRPGFSQLIQSADAREADRRSATAVLEVLENGIRMEMTDYRGNRIRREILLKSDSLYIRDQARGMTLQNYLHSIPEIAIDSSGDLTRRSTKYAPEFGLLQNIHQITVTGRDGIELTVSLA